MLNVLQIQFWQIIILLKPQDQGSIQQIQREECTKSESTASTGDR